MQTEEGVGGIAMENQTFGHGSKVLTFGVRKVSTDDYRGRKGLQKVVEAMRQDRGACDDVSRKKREDCKKQIIMEIRDLEKVDMVRVFRHDRPPPIRKRNAFGYVC